MMKSVMMWVKMMLKMMRIDSYVMCMCFMMCVVCENVLWCVM